MGVIYTILGDPMGFVGLIVVAGLLWYGLFGMDRDKKSGGSSGGPPSAP